MTADALYEQFVCHAELYGQAFFGWPATRAQKRQLDRLWKRALREAQEAVE